MTLYMCAIFHCMCSIVEEGNALNVSVNPIGSCVMKDFLGPTFCLLQWTWWTMCIVIS